MHTHSSEPLTPHSLTHTPSPNNTQKFHTYKTQSLTHKYLPNSKRFESGWWSCQGLETLSILEEQYTIGLNSLRRCFTPSICLKAKTGFARIEKLTQPGLVFFHLFCSRLSHNSCKTPSSIKYLKYYYILKFGTNIQNYL